MAIWVPRLVMKYDVGVGATRCPICNKLLGTYGFDLHEFLFTRGDLSGVEWQDEIFHPYNCVGVCHGKCHTEATSKQGQILCAKSILGRYYIGNVIEWIKSLPFKSHVMKTEALSIIMEAQNGKTT